MTQTGTNTPQTRGAKVPRALAETRRWAAPDSRSAKLFAEAQRVMPGGNTRTTVYMAPYPPYAASGDGCWITDVEGDRRLDCLNNYTALIHGHAHAAARAGLVVPATHARRGRAGHAPLRAPALGRARALHQLRERGGDDGDQGRAGLDGPAQDRQVRGRLPRLLRLRGGESQLRARAVGQPRRARQHGLLARRAARGARRRGGAAVQPRGAGGGTHRARGQVPRRGARGSDPEPRGADP